MCRGCTRNFGGQGEGIFSTKNSKKQEFFDKKQEKMGNFHAIKQEKQDFFREKLEKVRYFEMKKENIVYFQVIKWEEGGSKIKSKVRNCQIENTQITKKIFM